MTGAGSVARLVSVDPLSPLIVALDYPTPSTALELVRRLQGIKIGLFKVGSELFTASGPPLVQDITSRNRHVFLDLKFHDIPNTVAGAVAATARLGVWLLNVHASGGLEMMRAARRAAEQAEPRPRLIAVTLLTSLGAADLERAGISRTPQEQVLWLAEMAAEAGLDGVVASAGEAAALRRRFPRPFLIVTPGIRPAWADAAGDQKRVATPRDAMAAGADFIVVGRPITAAPDPAEAAARVLEELNQ